MRIEKFEERRIDVTDWPVQRVVDEHIIENAERIERTGDKVFAVMMFAVFREAV